MKNIFNNKGETMLEMVISIAIFALMMSFITTAFTAANNIETANYDARNQMNQRLYKVANAHLNNSDSLKDLAVSSEKTVRYSIVRHDGSHDSGQFYVKTISDKKTEGYEKVEVCK